MPRPQPFDISFDRRSFGVGSYWYCLVQYTWIELTDVDDEGNPIVVGGCWTLPKSVVGSIDLRPLSAQATAGGPPQGYAFVTSIQPIGTVIAHCLNFTREGATAAMRDAWEAIMDYRPSGDNLVDLIRDQLTNGSDPSGENGPKPLMPTTANTLEMWVGGHSRVYTEQFQLGKHPHSNRVRDVLRATVRSAFGDGTTQHYRKVLGDMVLKYRLKRGQWMDLVPRDLRRYVLHPLLPSTNIADTFDRPNDQDLNASNSGKTLDGAAGTWLWADVSGDPRIAGNDSWAPTTNSTICTSRADQDLSTDDHFSEILIGTASASGGARYAAVCARFEAAADTWYGAYQENFGAAAGDLDLRIVKNVAGVLTVLGSALGNQTVLGLKRISCNGSTLESYSGGVLVESITDVSLTGQLRAGLGALNSNWRISSWQAEDLAVAAAYARQLVYGSLAHGSILTGGSLAG